MVHFRINLLFERIGVIMKKIGIITLMPTRNYNYGGVLQNFALCSYLNKISYDCESIYFNASTWLNQLNMILYKYFNIWFDKKNKRFYKTDEVDVLRNQNFNSFIDAQIKPKRYSIFSGYSIKDINKRFDTLIVGSDQVWNPIWAIDKKTAKLYFLEFFSGRKISYAASIGTDYIPDDQVETFTKGLLGLDQISMREIKGAELVYSLIGKKPPVVLDPSMLLSTEEWKNISRKSPFRKEKPYILKYCLGGSSREMDDKIKLMADTMKCDVYDLLDKRSMFYTSGPREFIDLIAHSTAVFTDSFHATVFSFLFDKPFSVVPRVQEHNDKNSMFSRIDSFLATFGLNSDNLCYEYGEINLTHDYSEAYKILSRMREEASSYLRSALSK